MKFKHTNRPGFWFGFVDFCTAGVFFMLYMPLGGLQDELDYILGRRTQRYWVVSIVIPGYTERWGYELDKYQVYARFVLIDTVTGYRSQSQDYSKIIIAR